MYRSLLVPLDGSKFAEHALPLALAVARHSGAALRLVAVASPIAEVYVEGAFFASADLESQLRRQLGDYLDGVVGRLSARTSTPVFASVLGGEVASTLCEHASQTSTDLVVLATHGRGPLGRFWLGSVADELVRHLPMPVLLARPSEEEPDLGREPKLGRVLLPLDGTPLAEQIIEPAVNLASLMPAGEWTLLRVIKPTFLREGPALEAGIERGVEPEARALLTHTHTLQAGFQQQAEQYLATVAERLRGRGLRVQTQIAEEEQPAVAILREAKTAHAGLIALATHGRRGLKRLILGSVADKVIRAAHLPVLVQRPQHP
jgi:nucleotide-binding universal stress UspA family protein